MKIIPNLEKRIHACWLGKNVGGTLGGPHEGKPGPLTLTFYSPVPAKVLPNDDLDLQVVWLQFLLEKKCHTVTPDILAEAWRNHVGFPFDEYGIAQRNDQYGLRGEQRGAVDNYFAESMGAAIRTELWACVAAGDPAKAAALAWADAAVDHCGDGIHAAVFHAAIQAAAFVESDMMVLIEQGLDVLPEDSRLKQGLLDTLAWWDECEGDWLAVREKAVGKYATGNFTDVVCNLCFEVIGWLAGKGDFGKSICIAVNCGLDTDCTGATLGALLGILDPNCIPDEWRRPIGEDVVLSPGIIGIKVPADLTELTELTLRLRDQLDAGSQVVAPVLARRTAASGRVGHLLSFDEGYTYRLDAAGCPDATDWVPRAAKGHWQQFTAAEFSQPEKLLRLRFRVEKGQAIKLMTFYRSGIRSWVDARKVVDFSEKDLQADPFIAPSFHRAGKSSMVFKAGELSEGTHELIMLCQRPDGEIPADLIVGIGDPNTNLWLPNAIL